MIGVSKLYCGTVEPSDPLRFGRLSGLLPSHLLQFSADKKPVVVWNSTRRCNLHCVHCYSRSQDLDYAGELTTDEGCRLLDDLGTFGVPVILFSGGEPLMRPDLPELITHARRCGMRAVLSTNGTLITPECALQLKACDLSYVGISLDGLTETHDCFRKSDGAFALALAGIRHCRQAGIKVGLRFTMHRRNMHEIDSIFDLIEREAIPRVCFYHLVYAGRGSKLLEEALTHEQIRAVIDRILARTKHLHDAGRPLEVLTVDNHCDGPYIYLRLLQEDSARAAAAYRLLEMNGGNSSGIGIGCVSWDGTVYPDQFWRNQILGNVREHPFSEIWQDRSSELLDKLRERRRYISGRCAACKWMSICNGNFRARAEAATGDMWSSDPACYLTDEEIGVAEESAI